MKIGFLERSNPESMNNWLILIFFLMVPLSFVVHFFIFVLCSSVLFYFVFSIKGKSFFFRSLSGRSLYVRKGVLGLVYNLILFIIVGLFFMVGLANNWKFSLYSLIPGLILGYMYYFANAKQLPQETYQ